MAGLVEAYRDWMGQALRALEANRGVVAEKAGIVVACGMGGSGVVGDYLQALADSLGGSPVYVVKSHRLPRWVDEGTLVVAISYSGNTVETLHCYREAVRVGARRLVVTSGGRLGEEARSNGDPVAVVEKGPAARAMFASLFYAALTPLASSKTIPLSLGELEEAAKVLDAVSAMGEARGLAKSIMGAGKIPVFVACCEYRALAVRLKNEFNENAKLPAKVEILPELGHNDVEEWASRLAVENLFPVLLDPGAGEASELLKVFGEIVGEKTGFSRLVLRGESLLARLLWGSLVGGLASIEAGRLAGFNPEEIPLIKRYREKLAGVLGPEG